MQGIRVLRGQILKQNTDLSRLAADVADLFAELLPPVGDRIPGFRQCGCDQALGLRQNLPRLVIAAEKRRASELPLHRPSRFPELGCGGTECERRIQIGAVLASKVEVLLGSQQLGRRFWIPPNHEESRQHTEKE
jgi:hypothetical protein